MVLPAVGVSIGISAAAEEVNGTDVITCDADTEVDKTCDVVASGGTADVADSGVTDTGAP